jgi:hypothetical protein
VHAKLITPPTDLGRKESDGSMGTLEGQRSLLPLIAGAIVGLAFAVAMLMLGPGGGDPSPVALGYGHHPTPTATPSEVMPTPTPRPQQESGMADPDVAISPSTDLDGPTNAKPSHR